MTNSIINNISKDDFADNHFIRTIIENDLSNKKYIQIITRFPPEPNGYLHIGHVKSICLNFGLAYIFAGKCNLRFDDTNPEKESEEYVKAIKNDIKWLGFSWNGDTKFASDYFDKLYDFATELINKGLAYVDDLSIEKIKEYRGTLTTFGINSPYRNRSIEENLDLFDRMRKGEFADGTKTLRLKINMSHGNINLRDPIIYRIKHTNHIRTGNKWCIYPMYDYTHPICDALEHITHSLCTLEFEEHRPLYDWIIDNISSPSKPRQYEFSRLELLYSVTSKRKLNRLVTDGIVKGWDDPRMPTISGMRRRGYTSSGLRLFCKRIGISKGTNIIDFSVLETAIRDDLESKVPRMFAVLNPLKVELINFDKEKAQSKFVPFHANNLEFGERKIILSKYIYIEQDDFSLNPPPKWQRLELGKEVRLRYSYIIKCEEVIKDDDGNVVLLKCSIDYDTFGKKPEGRKVKGIVHWLSDNNFVEGRVRLYDRLFTVPRPDAVKDENGKYLDFINFINHDSCNEIKALIEPHALNLSNEDRYQFERIGYFVADRYDYSREKPIFNRILTLKDNWQK